MYKLAGQNSVQRLSDKACIPFADDNTDYIAYKLWLAEGNIPEPQFTEEELAQQELSVKVQEAKQYLNDTDYKMLPNYVPKVDEDLGAIITKRNEVREFIRGINNDNYR